MAAAKARVLELSIMKNNKITITKGNNVLHFFYHVKGVRKYLFSQKFSKGVYDYFKNGRLEFEVFAFKKWNHNPRLDKTISKLPMYICYVLKECA